jgi:predicted dehydrogenase
MRIALAGLGGAAVHGHLPAIRSLEHRHRLRLVAAADSEFKPHGSVEKALRGVPVFTSVESMLSSVQSDVLAIATEPSSHAGLVELGFDHDLHVVCEKPLALTKHHRASVKAAVESSNDLALVSVHQYRYSRTWMRLAPWMRVANALRLPFSLLAEVSRRGVEDPHAASSWRTELSTSGGMLADHGSHFIALAWTIDQRLSALDGKRLRQGPDGERSSGTIRVGSGVLELRMSTTSGARRTRVEARAPGLTINWQGSRLELLARGRRIASRRTDALSDRDYLDSLYHPFYADLAQNLSNDAWRTSRTGESLAVGTILVDLLEGAAS